jgi:hypothetical protein
MSPLLTTCATEIEQILENHEGEQTFGHLDREVGKRQIDCSLKGIF